MKKYSYFLTLLLICCIQSMYAQSNVSESLSIFQPEQLEKAKKHQILQSNTLQEGEIWRIDEQAFARLKTAASSNVLLQLPTEVVAHQILELEQIELTSPSFKVFNATNEASTYEGALHYRGSVQGANRSIVAISVFEEHIMGVIAVDGITYNLEKLQTLSKQNTQDYYIFYPESKVKNKPDFKCMTDETSKLSAPNRADYPVATQEKSGAAMPVDIYFECDYKMYTDFESVQATVDYTMGLFNMVAAIYNDAGVTVRISEIKVWDTLDPYEADIEEATSGNSLDHFRCEVPYYNGRLAHLLSTARRGLGGIAQLPYGCSYERTIHGFSGISTAFNTDLSTYSWSINVLAHELGHQMSSPHTHSCAWNGNDTPIDNCGSIATGVVDEETCWDSDNLVLPEKGTIMSYCHTIGSIGIDLSLGFHPQIREKLETFVSNCLQPLNACPIVGRSEIVIENLAEYSARLRCTLEDENITDYRFYYVNTNTESGTFKRSNGANFIDVDDLEPNTDYEVSVRAYCGSDYLSSSCRTTFTTLDRPICIAFKIDTIALVAPDCGESNGLATIELSSGEAPFSLAWEGTSSGTETSSLRTIPIMGLAKGGYTLRITDVNDCIRFANFELIEADSCRSLRCNRTTALTCGERISANLDGLDNEYDAVDVIGCVSSSNLDYSAADKIYTITLEETMEISLALTDLEMDIDLYLFDACEIEGNCIDASFRPRTEEETIDTELEAGTYYAVVMPYGDLEGDGSHSLSLSCRNCTDFIATTLHPIGSSCDTASGSIDIALSGGTPDFTVNWDGPIDGETTMEDSIFTISNLLNGAYSARIEDAEGCIEEVNFELYDACVCDGLMLDIVDVTRPTCNESDGTFTVKFIGGNPSYRYSWRGGGRSGGGRTNQNQLIFTSLREDTYTFEVMDQDSCVTTASFWLEEEDCDCSAFAVEVVDPVLPNCGDNNGSLTMNITGGRPFYRYEVTGEGVALSSGTNSTNRTFNGLSAGEYTFRVMDLDSCIATQTFALAEQECGDCADFTIERTNYEIASCNANDGRITLNMISGNPPYRYEWEGEGRRGTGSTGNDEIQLNTLPEGDYVFRVTDAQSCIATKALTMEEEECDCTAFMIEITDVILPSCGDPTGSLRVNLTGGDPRYRYDWGGGGRNGTISTSSASRLFDELYPGTYTFNVSDSDDCEVNQTFILEEGECDCSAFALEITNPILPTCNESDGSLRLNMIGGDPAYTYQWEAGESNGSGTINSQEGTLENLPTGEYSFTITDQDSCVATQTFSLAEQGCGDCAGFSIDLKNAEQLSCEPNSGKFDIGITGGLAGYTISWSGASTGTENVNGNWYTVRDLPIGTYSVTATDANACVTISQVIIEARIGCTPRCNRALPISCGQQLSGALNANSNDDYSDSDFKKCNNSNASYEAADQAYEFTLEEAAEIMITLTDLDEDIDIYLYDGCALDAACLDFSWKGGSDDEAITASLNAGTYYIVSTLFNSFGENNYKLSLSCGCDSDLEIELKNPTAANCNASDGKFDISLRGGTPDFVIAWSGRSSGTESINGNWYTLRNLAAGTYNVSVTDATNCVQESSITIPETGCLDGGTPGSFANTPTISRLEAFPNPTTGFLVTKIRFTESTTARLEVVNSIGQVIAFYDAAISDAIQHQFDLSEQPSGLYFLKLQTATYSEIQPIVLMR